MSAKRRRGKKCDRQNCDGTTVTGFSDFDKFPAARPIPGSLSESEFAMRFPEYASAQGWSSCDTVEDFGNMRSETKKDSGSDDEKVSFEQHKVGVSGQKSSASLPSEVFSKIFEEVRPDQIESPEESSISSSNSVMERFSKLLTERRGQIGIEGDSSSTDRRTDRRKIVAKKKGPISPSDDGICEEDVPTHDVLMKFINEKFGTHTYSGFERSNDETLVSKEHPVITTSDTEKKSHAVSSEDKKQPVKVKVAVRRTSSPEHKARSVYSRKAHIDSIKDSYARDSRMSVGDRDSSRFDHMNRVNRHKARTHSARKYYGRR